MTNRYIVTYCTGSYDTYQTNEYSFETDLSKEKLLTELKSGFENRCTDHFILLGKYLPLYDDYEDNHAIDTLQVFTLEEFFEACRPEDVNK